MSMRRMSSFMGAARRMPVTSASSTTLSTSAIACTASYYAQSMGLHSQTRPLLAKRGFFAILQEVNKRSMEEAKQTGKATAIPRVREIHAVVREEEVDSAGNVTSSSASTSSDSSSSGDSSSSSSSTAGALSTEGFKGRFVNVNLGVLILFGCILDMCRRMFLRSTGNGEYDYPYLPITVTSKENRARQVIMNCLWPTEAEKEGYKLSYLTARKQRPLLSFWDFMNESYPGWNAGSLNSGQQVLQSMMGAMATMTELQTINLGNKIHTACRGLPNAQARADVIVNTISATYGDNPAMKLAAGLAGAQGTGQMPTMRMTQGADGQMMLIDQNGNQVPVQSMQSMVQQGGMTMTPTGRVADGGNFGPGSGGMPSQPPMIMSGAPPGSTIRSVPFTSTQPSASTMAPAAAGGDHGSVPLFKE